jgi:hypothetical protein
MTLWKSRASRLYDRGTWDFSEAELSPALVEKFKDIDKNNIPDGIENMSTGARNDIYNSISDGSSLSDTPILSANFDASQRLISFGFSESATRDIEDIAQKISDGLSCGFG